MESKTKTLSSRLQIVIILALLGGLAFLLQTQLSRRPAAPSDSFTPFPVSQAATLSPDLAGQAGSPYPPPASAANEPAAGTITAYPPPEPTPRPRGQVTPDPELTVVARGSGAILVPSPPPVTIGQPEILSPENFVTLTALPIAPAPDSPAGELLFMTATGSKTLNVYAISTTAERTFGPAEIVGTLAAPESYTVFPSADGKRIALMDNDGRVIAYRLDAGLAGSGPPQSDRFFGWHPDQIHLIYQLIPSFLLFNTDSGEIVPMMKSTLYFGSVDSVAFSPDGLQVAFAVNDSKRASLKVAALKTGTELIHIEEPGIIWNISWSPDGRNLAFFGGANGLEIINLESGQVKKIETECFPGDFDVLQWSPDSRYFAYTDFQVSRGLEKDWKPDIFLGARICLIDLQQGETTRLLPEKETGYLDPAWSPDGQEIAFVWHQGGMYDIYAVKIESGEVRQVTADGALKRFLVWGAAK